MKHRFTQRFRLVALPVCVPKVTFVAVMLFTCLLVSIQAMAQALTVTGRVTDVETGTGLPGVTVLLKGTTVAAPTGADGSYTINVPNGTGTLVFSFIGYQTQEVPVNNRATINVQLGTDAKALEEVVVVGYGTQRAEAVTGSVASISSEEIAKVPSGNITQALQGRLPGVQFSQSSSQPGASMQIRIRGTRSISAENDPLVVLDGIPFPGAISDINPNDIKSIDILKDASATAIYGSRGANGVILVTTKTGKAGQKPQVSYNSFHGVKNVFAKYNMMDGAELFALRQAAGLFTGQLGEDEAEGVNTDWQDLLYRTGITTSHDVGVSGGTEQGRYNFSVGYFEDEGVIPTQQYTRYSMRGSIDQGIGENFRVGFSTYNNYNITEGSNVGLYGILSMSPLASPYNEDGTLKRTIRTPLDETWLYTRDIVEDLTDEWLSQTRAFATYNTLYGEVEIPGVEGLKYRANLGLNYRQSHGGAYTAAGVNSANPTTLSTASVSNAVTTNWTIENLLTYDRTFAGKHNVNLVGLYSASEEQYNRSRMAARDIPSDAFQFYNLGQAAGEITVNPGDQHYTKWGLLSWMGRAMYSYDDRYMLSATVRSDGSSRLAPGHKWHTYPAVSLGWNLARESFMQDISLVNRLKLRVGYGQTSNQAVSPYSTLGLLSTRPYNFGPDVYETGYYVSQLPNPALGWEYSETWNYGLDFAILNNRLSGTVEYYVTNTNDILLSLGLPPTSGVSSYTANIGSTQNKGLELSLNAVILEDLNGWTWEAGVNVYGNRNRIVALASGANEDKNNWLFVGHPINVIYDYEKIGLWQENDPHRDILEPNPADPSRTIGMIKVRYTGEYNSDGTPVRQIGADDRQIMNANPDFQGGFNTRVGYKGFDLTAVAAFQSGGILNSTLYGASGYLNMLSGRRGNVDVDYWTPENTDAKYPNPASLRSGDNPKYASTLGYFDASYLKIRTITLGYNFQSSSWLEKVGVNNLRLYATAQNPFVLFSPYHRESGMDPETNSYANQNVAVTGGTPSRLLTIGTNAPATRNYLIGLNVTF
ncbi:TonB-linked SusC/RagA family outer membrane protein [Pontibacter ummariensis]|uniref:TonB-linked outer membrane protein, SusC/RagA family n=1 Tax=Pontibacter ummariensis TaxID=1610492 RepID=A0A239DNR7_9BACT|nr:TonB-dependent receptor [Pontibacter ummariensis]PRY13859.1 TonB-linked SusC/RagA family outer membrane protein [Pontibacter ummariensis]SNS33402.1 TonB-linked outer membrane protein, SusC/RagA family [Pontibacter ummariensis]